MLIKRPKMKKPPETVLEERRERFQEVRRVGRPPGARNRLSEQFIGDLQEIWDRRGPEVLQRLEATDPIKLAELVGRLIPREFQMTVQHAPRNVDPVEWEKLLRIASTLKEIAPQAEPDEIEEALRAGFANTIVEQ